MHTHERTLIQQLFSEKDHKSPAHEGACLYLQSNACSVLSEELVGKKQLGHYTRSILTEPYCKHFEHEARQFKRQLEGGCKSCQFTYSEADRYPVESVVTEIIVDSARLEKLITTGGDRYHPVRHIGFLDVSITYSRLTRYTYLDVQMSVHRNCQFDREHVATFPFTVSPFSEPQKCGGFNAFFEVKTSPTPLGDVLRQLKLYQLYSNAKYGAIHHRSDLWILAASYDLPDEQIVALKNEGIGFLRLPNEFAGSQRLFSL